MVRKARRGNEKEEKKERNKGKVSLSLSLAVLSLFALLSTYSLIPVAGLTGSVSPTAFARANCGRGEGGKENWRPLP